MTKADLIAALSNHDPDAHIFVRIDGEDYEISKVDGTWDVADDGHTQVDSKKLAFIVCDI